MAFDMIKYSENIALEVNLQNPYLLGTNDNYEGELDNKHKAVQIFIPTDNVNEFEYTGRFDTATVETVLSASELTLIADQQRAVIVRFDEIEKMNTGVDLEEVAGKLTAQKLTKTQRQYLANVFYTNTPAGQSITKTVSTGKQIYEAMLELLEFFDVEDGIKLYLPKRLATILKSDLDLLKALGFTSEKEVMVKGYVGKLAGFEIFEVKDNPVEVNGALNMLAVHPNGTTLAQKLLKNKMVDATDAVGEYLQTLFVYGSKTILPKYLAKATITIA